MSELKHHAIAYCIDNQELADKIAADLLPGGHKLHPMSFSENIEEGTPAGAFPNAKGKIVLLLTDNFLKTAGCMYGTMAAVRNALDAGKLVVVIADGKQRSADGHSWEAVPTSFDRVSNIIPYMNHWQDRYLDLRRERRHHENDPILEHKIEVTQAISGDVGELLRFLRNVPTYSLEEFSANNYNLFFKSNNEENPLVGNFANRNPIVQESLPGKKDLAQIIQESSEGLMAENPEQAGFGKQADEPSEADLAAIPGMDLLKENPLQPDDLESLEEQLLGVDDDEWKAPSRHEIVVEIGSEAEEPADEDANNISLDELSDAAYNDDLDGDLVDKLLADDAGTAVKVHAEKDDDDDDFDLQSIFDQDEEEVELEEDLDKEEEVIFEMSSEAPAPEPVDEAPNAEEILENAIGYFDQGHTGLGMDYLRTAVEGQPDNPTLRYYYSYSLARYGQNVQEADQQLGILLEQSPEYADAWFLRAELAEFQEDFEAAKRYFEKITAFEPDYPDVHYRLGLLALLHAQGQEATAASHFKKAVEQNKKNSDAHYRLALLLSDHLDEPQRAAKHFKKALKYHPEHPFANYDLALLYHRLGEQALAHHYYHKAAETNPELRTEQNDEAFFFDPLALVIEEDILSEEDDSPMEEAVADHLHSDEAVTDDSIEEAAENAAAEQEVLDDLEAILEEEAGPETEAEAPIAEQESPDEVALESSERIDEATGNIAAGLAALDNLEDVSEEASEPETVSEVIAEAPVLEEENIAKAALGYSEEIAEVIENVAAELGFVDDMSMTKTIVLEIVDTTANVTEQTENQAIAFSEPETAAVEKPQQKTVLVTGGTSGIGRATAELFAKNGYRVIITGRREERLVDLKNEWAEAYGADILTLHFDVRSLGSVKYVFDNLPEGWQDIDILINNAGLSRGLAPIHEGDIEHWETMIDTNIKGLLYMTRIVAPLMVARRQGHIINVASSAGKEVYPGGNVYCATKFAVDALTKAMRLDLYKHNIRVSQVAPGHVEETEFASVRFDGDAERAASVYEGFQPLRASDVAEAIYFMATRPAHVNVQDMLMYGTQQAGSSFIDRSGREG